MGTQFLQKENPPHCHVPLNFLVLPVPNTVMKVRAEEVCKKFWMEFLNAIFS
jgi:hypothetical protein